MMMMDFFKAGETYVDRNGLRRIAFDVGLNFNLSFTSKQQFKQNMTNWEGGTHGYC
jgi:hypothetical protein